MDHTDYSDTSSEGTWQSDDDVHHYDSGFDSARRGASHQDAPVEVSLDPKKATELKAAGNDRFHKLRFEEALDIYSEGLRFLPLHGSSVRKTSTERRSSDTSCTAKDDKDVQNPSDSSSSTSASASVSSSPAASSSSPASSTSAPPPAVHTAAASSSSSNTSKQPVLDADIDISQLRCVLHSNKAACYMKLENWESTVESCTLALLDDPNNMKCVARRARANEIINTWSSLSAALEDQKQLPDSPAVRNAIRRLEPLIEARKKEETDQMLTKMKNLGNSLLGRFGLSTDNFKFTQGGDGKYKVDFVP